MRFPVPVLRLGEGRRVGRIEGAPHRNLGIGIDRAGGGEDTVARGKIDGGKPVRGSFGKPAAVAGVCEPGGIRAVLKKVKPLVIVILRRVVGTGSPDERIMIGVGADSIAAMSGRLGIVARTVEIDILVKPARMLGVSHIP